MFLSDLVIKLSNLLVFEIISSIIHLNWCFPKIVGSDIKMTETSEHCSGANFSKQPLRTFQCLYQCPSHPGTTGCYQLPGACQSLGARGQCCTASITVILGVTSCQLFKGLWVLEGVASVELHLCQSSCSTNTHCLLCNHHVISTVVQGEP